MQACCTANPSNCGPVNPDYSVFQNLAACGACAPPTLGNYAYGKFKPYTGWDTTSMQVYIDPALDSYKFPDGSTSAGTVQDSGLCRCWWPPRPRCRPGCHIDGSTVWRRRLALAPAAATTLTFGALPAPPAPIQP